MTTAITDLLFSIILASVAKTSVQKEDVQLVKMTNSGVQFSCNVTDDSVVRWHFTAINRDAETVFVKNIVPAAFARRFNVSVDRTRGVSDFYIEHVTSQDAGHYDCVNGHTGHKLFDMNLTVLQTEPTCNISKQMKNETWNGTSENAVIITCTLCYTGQLKDHVTCTGQIGGNLTVMHHSNTVVSNGSCKYHQHELDDNPAFDQTFTCNMVLKSSTGSEHYSYSWSHEYTLSTTVGDQQRGFSTDHLISPTSFMYSGNDTGSPGIPGRSSPQTSFPASQVALFGSLGLLLLTAVLCVSIIVYVRQKGPTKLNQQPDLLPGPTAGTTQPSAPPSVADLSAMYAQVKKPTRIRPTTAASAANRAMSSTSFMSSLYAEVAPSSQRCRSILTPAAENNTNTVSNPAYAEVTPRNRRHRLAVEDDNSTETCCFANPTSTYSDIIPFYQDNIAAAAAVVSDNKAQSTSPAAVSATANATYAEVVPRCERIPRTAKDETNGRQPFRLTVFEPIPEILPRKGASSDALTPVGNGDDSIQTVPYLYAAVAPRNRATANLNASGAAKPERTEINIADSATADGGSDDKAEEPIFGTFVRVPVGRKPQ